MTPGPAPPLSSVAPTTAAPAVTEPRTSPRGRDLARRAQRRTTRRRRIALLPGWPLVALFVGFPLWWLLGFGVLGPLVAAVPMAYYLLTRREIRVPRGFGTWLLFLMWVGLGITVLWTQPDGTAPVAGLDRLVPFGYRICWYAAATIILLYIGNLSRSQLSDRRIYRLLGWLFLVTVVGGYVGYFAPGLPVRSALELILPAGLVSNDFLALLIHPNVAQLQDIGVQVTRPSAPYVYANDWGANAGLLAPFFVLAWTGPDAGWRRRVFPLVAVGCLPPIIFSLNRGLWLGLAVSALFVAVRLGARGRLGALAGVVAAAVLTVALLVTTPLGDLVTERFANQHSNEGRSALAVRAVETTLSESPLLGFGSTRELNGNFYSIAGGDSAACPGCSPPQLGTQGHLWLLVFGHGLVGTALFVGFVGRRFVAGLRDPSRDATALGAVVVFYASVMVAYDLLTLPTVLLMIALAVLWRRESAVEAPPTAIVRTRSP